MHKTPDFDRLDSGEPRITVQDWDAPTSSSESESICLQRPVEKNKLNSRVRMFFGFVLVRANNCGAPC